MSGSNPIASRTSVGKAIDSFFASVDQTASQENELKWLVDFIAQYARSRLQVLLEGMLCTSSKKTDNRRQQEQAQASEENISKHSQGSSTQNSIQSSTRDTEITQSSSPSSLSASKNTAITEQRQSEGRIQSPKDYPGHDNDDSKGLTTTGKRPSADTEQGSPASKRRKIDITPDSSLERMIMAAQHEAKGKPLIGSTARFLQTIEAAKDALKDKDGVLKPSDRNLVARLGTWFARNLFGSVGVKHLHAFIISARQVMNSAPMDITGTPNNDQLSSLVANQPSLSNVVSAFHKQSDTMKHSVLSKCTRYVHLSRFYRLHIESIKQAMQEDSAVQQELKALQLNLEKGRGWKNVYLDWLLSSLYGVPISEIRTNKSLRNKFRMEVRLAKHIHLLEQYFGQGIFALLPDDCVSSIRQWHSLSVEGIFKSVIENMPETVTLCAEIDRRILQPILRGEKPERLIIEGTGRERLGMTFDELIQTQETSDIEPASEQEAIMSDSESEPDSVEIHGVIDEVEESE